MTEATGDDPLEEIRRSWAVVQRALNEHHEFWREFSACTSGNRADHPGDLYNDLVSLGDAAERVRRHRDLFAGAAAGVRIGKSQAERAARECERHRHLLGRVMAHVAFRALVERAIASGGVSKLGLSANSLASEWTSRLPVLTVVGPSSPEDAEEQAEWRQRDERDAREDEARRARMGSLASEIETMVVAGREGRTRIEALIDHHSNAPELVPFSVLCEAAANGDMEWDGFRRAVLRTAAKLRDQLE